MADPTQWYVTIAGLTTGPYDTAGAALAAIPAPSLPASEHHLVTTAIDSGGLSVVRESWVELGSQIHPDQEIEPP